jgi:hypothetical protein
MFSSNSVFDFFFFLYSLIATVDPSVKASMNNYIGPFYLVVGKPTVQSVSSAAAETDDATKLWTESERLTGQNFTL